MINLWKPLITKRLLLRKIEFQDIDFIFEHFSDEEVCQYMVDNETITTIDEAEDIINWSHSTNENPTNNRWLIVFKKTHQPIGTIGFHRWDRDNNSAEIGYDLKKSYWNKGLMSEALMEVLSFGFNDMNLNRIQAFVHVDNKASHYLLKKIGFVCEGIIRDMYFYRGTYHDHYLMALLKTQ